jgi:hypothetical protein
MERQLEIDTHREDDGRTVSERDYQIKSLWNHHQEMIRRAACGEKPKDIAAALDVTPATVGNVIHSELGKKAIRAIQAEMNANVVDVGRRIREIAPTAIELIDKVINYDQLEPDQRREVLLGEVPDIKTRIATSLDILDRAGHTPIRKVAGIIAHGVMTRSDLEEIKRRGERISLKQAEDIEEAKIKSINSEEEDA